jgi:hypothetical protein
MAYSADYEEADIAEATINTIVKMIITVGTVIVVIVLLLLWGWMKKKAR